MTKDNDKTGGHVTSGIKIDQSVTSYNQLGGVTAHTVHMRAQARNLDDPDAAAFKQKLLSDLDRSQAISIYAIAGDHEAHQLAFQIRAFLSENGFEVRELASLMTAPPPSPGVGIYPNQIIVGPNP